MEGQGDGSGVVEGTNNPAMMSDDVLDLPPGFRFHPTDEEVVTHYLTPKVLDSDFVAAAITEVDLNKCEPWDMPSRAKIGEKDWYFFCQKDRKYPTGTRTNRATKAGYWKATGKDKEIYRGRGKLVGMKKTLVFYKGRAPKGEKTNWVMHEFRVEGQFPFHHLPHVNKDEWVVCRVFNKSMGGIVVDNDNFARQPEGMNFTTSFIDELLENSSPPPPPLVDPANIAFCNYSSKWEYGDLVDGISPAGSGHLPRLPLQNYSPFGNSCYSLQGQMDSKFSEGLELQARPDMSVPCQGEQFTLSRDEIGFEGSKGTGVDANNNETSSAVTTMNRSDSGMCIDGAYYGYLESSLMGANDDYDLTLESLMNQENPSFLPIEN